MGPAFERPRRTREHIIASQSHNFIEKFFIDRGHTVDRPGQDYGSDVIVNTFGEAGYAESGQIFLQLKAGDTLKFIKNGTFIAYEVAAKHYALWTKEPMPVFLILYDAQRTRGYWLYVQEYFASDPSRKPRPGVRTLTLRIPAANLFSEATVDYAREEKRKILARI